MALQLDWISGEGLRVATTPETAPHRRRFAFAALASAIVMMSAVAFAIGYFLRPAPVNSLHRVSIMVPENGYLVDSIALSPNGEMLVFQVLDRNGRSRLWLRSFDFQDPRPIPGTDGALYPFWSPDSRFIAFFNDRELNRVDLFGSSPQLVCKLPAGTDARGGAWNQYGQIILGTTDNTQGLYIVDSEGGIPRPLTQFDQTRKEYEHSWPSFLPDGRHFLYMARNWAGRASINVGATDTDPIQYLCDAESGACFAPSGNLLFVRNSSLYAQGFDASARALRGDPVLLEKDLDSTLGIDQRFSVSSTGKLAYIPGRALWATEAALVERTGMGLYAEYNPHPDGRFMMNRRINRPKAVNVILNWPALLGR